jgi:RHS repeat-associated protein
MMKAQKRFWKLTLMVLVLLGGLRTATAYYDPGAQRWVNRDPLGESGFEAIRRRSPILVTEGSNPYQFVHQNPVNRNDMWGLVSNQNPTPEPTPCGKPKLPTYPQLSPNCAKDPDVALSYKKLQECRSDSGDGNAECTTMCECLAQEGNVNQAVCWEVCSIVYEKTCLKGKPPRKKK